VRCSDCHDVHSVRTVKDGNALCLQCHPVAVYDSKRHHFHKKPGETGDPIRSPGGEVLFEVGTGASCVQCHMPGRTYMGIDYRPDHSFRIPRPDLSERLGTPDACIRCHADKTSRWADEAVTKWYGPGRRAHYGEILASGREQSPQAKDALIRLAADPLYPVIVRATVLELLRQYPGEDVDEVYEKALLDGEALIRRTAVSGYDRIPPDRRLAALVPMLYDPVKAVRIEAARQLADLTDKTLDPDQGERFESTLAEYRQAMAYSADFAFGRFNLANLYVSLGEPEKAVENYLAAVRIDDRFIPARVNLAMLYNRQGKNREAEQLLQEAVTIEPDLYEVHYSLGLLLAEEKRYEAAVDHLAAAAAGMPDRPRIYYNLGLLLDFLKRDAEAVKALWHAFEIAPENPDFLKTLVEYYLKRRQFESLKRVAEHLLAADSESQVGMELLKFANQAGRLKE
jgi:tetratricopeptide (TPR) repeat protein